MSALGADGHPAKGDFLPPVPLPRRMWAGSRLEFVSPIVLGAQAQKRSRVASVEEKSGRSGTLCFVTVQHEVLGAGGIAIREEQDIVYRDVARGAVAPPTQNAPTTAVWRHAWTFEPPRLFRYSALTFNSHRIHYDRDYAAREESYPGLVVHGPMLATLMLELVRTRAPERTVRQFEFRAIAPVFDGQTVHACAAPDGDSAQHVWIEGANGALHMRGRVTMG
jgi:3-methylfumaryl-CoA hydratase